MPLARYYANNKEKLPTRSRRCSLATSGARTTRRRGRFRQFTQCDIDILGDDSSLAEIELITATATMLSKISAEANLNAFTIHINDRRMLAAAALTAGFEQEEIGGALISLDKFDKIGMDGIERICWRAVTRRKRWKIHGVLPQRKAGHGDCRLLRGRERRISGSARRRSAGGHRGCVQPMLGEGVKIVFDPTLVRGMGYYTGPIFEVTLDGYNFAIAGGGRYDQMIGKFSGQNVSACGFSIGFERIVTILAITSRAASSCRKTRGVSDRATRAGRRARRRCSRRRAEARKAGVVATVLPMSKNMKHQIELLEAEGFTKFKRFTSKAGTSGRRDRERKPMTNKGLVTAVNGDTLTVAFECHEACGDCHACMHGSENRAKHMVKIKGKAQVGDASKWRWTIRHVMEASALAYMLPLAGFIAGLAAGWGIAKTGAFGNGELLMALCAIIGTAAAYFIMRALIPSLQGALGAEDHCGDASRRDGCEKIKTGGV